MALFKLSGSLSALHLASAMLAVVAAGVMGCSRPQPPAPAAATASPAAASMPGRTTVAGEAPTGAVVTLEPAPPREHALPPGPAVLDQYAKTFVPDTLIVRVGQVVEFRNSEDIDHNVVVTRSPTGTRVFDTSTPPHQRYEYTFDRPGRYDVSCDIHPGMRATIVTTTAPHAVAVDASRRFSFADVEPGSYKLTVSSHAGQIERTIEVSGARVDLGALNP